MKTSPNRESKTEARLSLDRTLDACSALEMVRLMNSEDARVHQAVARVHQAIAIAVEMTADAFSKGGRLIYMGAGTSGRLGMLDASECPPTFGVSPGQVVALIAGGQSAFFRSIENAEDDTAQAAKDLEALDPAACARDIVIGITASGTTPYALAGLDAARSRGAQAVLVCCNPDHEAKGYHCIAVDTGPEVLAGSTRLKAGTATKMVLNMITTGAMALSGHVFQGLMIHMRPSNAKLWKRAVKIVATLADNDLDHAEALLQKADGRTDVAVVMARKSLDAHEAARLLAGDRELLRSLFRENRASEGVQDHDTSRDPE